MEAVLFFFKGIEIIGGTACMALHIQGFLDDRQPLPHEMIFCGTYFGFTVIAIFGNIGLNMGSKPNMVIEAGVSSAASFLFITSSILAMHHAEKDFHLMYLSDYEESVHPFFAISKQQSLTSLFCGLFYLLHALLAFDAILITEEKNYQEYSESIASVDFECYQPITLYFLGKPTHEFLLRQKWVVSLIGYDVRDTREKAIQKMFKDPKYVRYENII